MIYGSGMIASALGPTDCEEDILFASGVSNSMEADEKAFQREENLLIEAIQKNALSIGIIHYFSTAGVEMLTSKSRPYFHHKKKMEERLIDSVPASKLRIYRLPNVVGHSNNPNTLTNFIYRSIQIGKTDSLDFEAPRELLDIAKISPYVISSRKSKQVILRIRGIKCTVGEIVDVMCTKDIKSPDIQKLLSKYYSLPVAVGKGKHHPKENM